MKDINDNTEETWVEHVTQVIFWVLLATSLGGGLAFAVISAMVLAFGTGVPFIH